MSLTICVVTRNAAETLPDMLASVAHLGAEVLVVETGSSDATSAIAERAGAKVLHHSWDDNFALAQNFGIEHANSEWILWLNPDEELAPGATLAPILGNSSVMACAARVLHRMTPDPAHPASESASYRLFRKHPDIRFVGRLQPHFETPLEEVAARAKMGLAAGPLTIIRHAYRSLATPDKIRWTNRLLQLELADRPGQLHYQIELGRNLLLLNVPTGHDVLADATRHMLANGQDAAPPDPNVASLLEYLLLVSPEQNRSGVDHSTVRELVQRWFPQSPPLLWALAEREYRANDFAQAAKLLEQLLQMGRTNSYDRRWPFEMSILGARAQLNLARAYAQLSEWDKARVLFAPLLRHPEFGTEAAQGFEWVEYRCKQ